MVKVVVAVWGTELMQFLATLAILHQDDLQKRLNRITATWQNGCFEKMDVPPVHITANSLPKSLFLLKLFFKSSLSVPKVIDFPRFKMECNGENVILRGIFHVL